MPRKRTQGSAKSRVEAIVPRELPIYRFTHPYGSISVYIPAGTALTPERVLLLLEQAKHDLLNLHMVAIKKPEDTE